ncbi:hypothetical protein OF83DRAFT_1139124 [Amylostereum chailletii]|nr:hypothetical protein OF83DRAFT_1139124 [Amylostereum chailletii]
MPRSYFARGNPCLEFELDENDRPIGHPCDGFKLTKRAQALCLEKWRKCVDKRPPIAQLPVELRPKHPEDGTPLLHYGFVIEEEDIMACAIRNNIINDETKPSQRYLFAVWGVFSFVCRETRALVYHRSPLSIEHKHMVSLYSNHSIEEDEYDEEDEREIIEIVKRELNIPESTPLMWWWDAIENGPGPEFDRE